MKVIDVLNELELKYGLKSLYRMNIFPVHILVQRDIFLEYDTNLRIGSGPTEAVRDTAHKFNIDERTVYRAIKKMNEDDKTGNSYTGIKKA